MRDCCRKLIILAAVLFPLSVSADSLSIDFRVFKTVRASFQRAAKRIPVPYTVPVFLSGSAADEVIEKITALGIDKPGFIETLDKKRVFRLLLTNDNYTSGTREMLSGILNPVEMMDVILRSVMKYSDDETIATLQKETSLSAVRDTLDGHSVIRVVLTPKGTRFNYSYRDMGAYLYESWLTGLTMYLDSSGNLPYQLSYSRSSRYAGGAFEGKTLAASTHLFRFRYEHIDGERMPGGLRIYIDGKPTAELTVVYRQEEKNILFERRKIRYIGDAGQTSEITVEYGDYAFEMPKLPDADPTGGGEYAEKLRKASERSREATQALSEGKLSQAAEILKTIMDRYPGTPQAVEAQRILSGIMGKN